MVKKINTRELTVNDSYKVVSGARTRNPPSMFSNEAIPKVKHAGEPEIKKGKGKILSEIPGVQSRLKSVDGNDKAILMLHRLCFGRTSTKSARKNILHFSGRVGTTTADLQAKVAKQNLSRLRKVCRILTLNDDGDKDEVIERVVKFLMKPAKQEGGAKSPKKVTSSPKTSPKSSPKKPIVKSASPKKPKVKSASPKKPIVKSASPKKPIVKSASPKKPKVKSASLVKASPESTTKRGRKPTAKNIAISAQPKKPAASPKRKTTDSPKKKAGRPAKRGKK